ncbi:MAG: molybdopterin cofactor-binding domain-containing protein [bacterium]
MKEDRYLELDFTDITARYPINRRDFLKLSGGGIFIIVTLRDVLAHPQERRRRRFRLNYPTDFNAYLKIGEDGKVTCFTGKIEMGQGIVTSLAQMIADELEVSLESVEMVMGDTDLCPWDLGTFGSMTTRFFGPALRAAGAEAKAVLMDLASEHLKVPTSQLTVKDGVVLDKTKKDHQVTYAQLAQGKKITRHLQEKAAVKKASEFKIMGRPVLRRDAIEKVTGQAKFAADIHFPEMLYARILRPPAHGAKLIHADTSVARKIEGVQIVQEGDLIAVLHKYPDEAEKALAKIEAKFDLPESKLDDENIFEHLLKVAPEGNTVAQGGDIKSGEKHAAITFEETYLNSYVSHAPIEPHSAVAKIEGDRITVWASTQRPFGARDEIAEALGWPAEKVRVITPYVGGGFGGKGRNQQAIEAARLAKVTKKPVQVAWTRAEEFFYDTFRPAAIVKIKSGITDTGKVAFWDYHVYFAGERGSQQFYDIPHHRTVVHGSGWRGTPGSHPFRTGAWRAPANNTNTFARESQIDMMAAKAGMDPLEFRLKNLTDKKIQRVLKAAAEKFGWTPSKTPSDRGFGIACAMDVGSYVATMAEVEVDKATGNVHIKRVVCAQDMGLVINPEGARIQIEGCIMMGLGYALTEEIHFRGGEVKDFNFNTYEIPRFSWLPEIETVLIDSEDPNPHGCGEPAIVCMGAVIANAIFDATGARLFQLPMTPERIEEAMRRI